MTVTYSSHISNTQLCAFLKLLLRWRGSVFKLLWRELASFLFIYYILNFVYRFALTEEQKPYFEQLAIFCEKYSNNIPLTFVLGFYVSIVYNRWWAQFQTVTWPDRLCLYINAFVRGNSDRAKIIRRSSARYLTLSQVLGLRLISGAVYRRYPTMKHILDSGLIREDELKMFNAVGTEYPKEFIPLIWASSLFYTAKTEGIIESDRFLLEMLREVNDYRQSLRQTRYYDWITVPLVYTQVVTVAVYSFYITSLMGRQQLDTAIHQQALKTKIVFDSYFPGFTILQLIIYIGWLKVAEVMMNPFGEDDDDFELDFIVCRNQEVKPDYILFLVQVCEVWIGWFSDRGLSVHTGHALAYDKRTFCAFLIALLIADDLHNQMPPFHLNPSGGNSSKESEGGHSLRRRKCGYFGSTPAARGSSRRKWAFARSNCGTHMIDSSAFVSEMWARYMPDQIHTHEEAFDVRPTGYSMTSPKMNLSLPTFTTERCDVSEGGDSLPSIAPSEDAGTIAPGDRSSSPSNYEPSLKRPSSCQILLKPESLDKL